MGGFNPSGIQDGQGRVKNSAHIVHSSLQDITPINICWEELMNLIQNKLVAVRRQRSQWYGFLDSEDACLGWTIRTGGINKCFSFRNAHIGNAPIIADDLAEFNRPTGPSGMQDDNLPIR